MKQYRSIWNNGSENLPYIENIGGKCIEYVFVSYPPLTREYSEMFKANSETLNGEMFSLGETLS